jgi:hypothetical protein
MRSVLLIVMLLAATTAIAQTDKPQQDEAQVEMRLKQELEKMRIQQELNACPVSMYAHQQGDPVAMWTTSLEDANKFPYKSDGRTLMPHTGVHVNLNAQRRAIKQVELVVSFMPPGTRVLPVTGSQFQSDQKAPASEAQKNFELYADDATGLKLSGNLLLGPVADITRVTLVGIHYADGGSWTAPAHNSCSIKPSLYMPVDAK